MELNLADELALLVYDDTSGALRAGSQQVDYGLAGAVMTELMLAGRVTVPQRHVEVTDPRPTGDPEFDHALAQLRSARRARPPKDWIGPLSKGLRQRRLDALVAGGLLRREQRRVLGLFSRTVYPGAAGPAPMTQRHEIRGRLQAAVAAAGPVDQRTAALCALVRATRVERVAVPDRPRREVRAGLKAVVDQSWPADAVRKALAEMDAALSAAVGGAVASPSAGG